MLISNCLHPVLRWVHSVYSAGPDEMWKKYYIATENFAKCETRFSKPNIIWSIPIVIHNMYAPHTHFISLLYYHEIWYILMPILATARDFL